MKMNRRLGLLSLILILMFAIVPAVSAHPLGNFTINHYTGIQIGKDRISLEYILDMAEIPAFQEISLLDRNQNGKADPEELIGYSSRQCANIRGTLLLQRNHVSIPIIAKQSDVSFPRGAGGLSTLRLTCHFESTAFSMKQGDQVSFQDTSFSDRIGWREIVVDPQGIQVQGQYATTSVSKKLSAYPQDLLSSPLDVRQVTLAIGPAAATSQSSAPQAAGQKTAPWSAGVRSDRFTEMITLQDFTPLSVLVALLIAFIWGGLHSFTPGHGKTIVAAYLVGSRGTALHALYLGLMTTLTHTAGVFLLGLITLFASRYILPDQLFPWISLASGALVVSIGLVLFFNRLRGSQAWSSWVQRIHKETGIQVDPRSSQVAPVRLASISAVRVPVTGEKKLAPGLFLHHDENGISHSHPVGAHTHPHEHTHGSGSHSHSHLPPEVEAGKVTWRSLFALGVSGGLLPCPSALVVLLGAIALNRIGFGILLVLVFSLGLAGVLTAIGLALVYARKIFDRLPLQNRFVELIPAGSALFITILGLGVTFQAAVQLGWISPL